MTAGQEARPGPAYPGGRLAFEVDHDGETIIVRIRGMLTLGTAPVLCGQLLKCLAECPTGLIVDVFGLTADSDLPLTVFRGVQHQARRWPGIAMVVYAPGGTVNGLAGRVPGRGVPVYPTMGAAVAALDQPVQARPTIHAELPAMSWMVAVVAPGAAASAAPGMLEKPRRACARAQGTWRSTPSAATWTRRTAAKGVHRHQHAGAQRRWQVRDQLAERLDPAGGRADGEHLHSHRDIVPPLRPSRRLATYPGGVLRKVAVSSRGHPGSRSPRLR